MLRRLWQLLSTLFPSHNSDVLVTAAHREMRERRVQSLLDAVQSCTDRDSLQILIRSTQEHIDGLKAQAELAFTETDALRLAREIKEYEEYLAIKQQRLIQAARDVEEAKQSIRREEERIRQKTAEALALKAQWKNSQIPSGCVSSTGPADPEQLHRITVTMEILVVLVVVVVLCAVVIGLLL